MPLSLHARPESMTTRSRLDVALHSRGLAPSRARAQSLIRDGRVTVDGTVVTRPGSFLDDSAVLVVAPRGDDFASRGGNKLDPALEAFGLVLDGHVVVDVGASTGGFTDAVLRRGAKKVYAVDVGHDQLDARLVADPRVVVRDHTNARDLVADDFDDVVDTVVVDASFISLSKLSDALARILPAGGTLVALVKPQFEVGPEIARRTRGVVRDEGERAAAIDAARRDLERAGFSVVDARDSALPGPKGNVEHFLYARRRAQEP
jgi:23S rRNA (cytidine1920-2'-O)/16S rRNA (cytidine1409-2'-O)-methyltransferase